MPQTASPLQLDDFSGGINENHLLSKINEYQVADNLVITNNGKLEQRPGSVVIDESADRPAEERIGHLFEFKGELYAIVENKIFRKTTASWTEISGTSSNSGLGFGDRNTSSVTAPWNNHIFVTGDSGGKVQKIYKDDTNTLRLRTAGMPAINNSDNFVKQQELSNMITRATDIRTALNSHFINITTAHSSADFVSSALLPNTTPVTEAELKVYTGKLLRAYDNHFQDYIQDKRTFHTSPNSEPVVLLSAQITTTNDPTTFLGIETSLNDLFIKINQHSGDEDIHNSNKVDLINPATNDLLSAVSNGPAPTKSIQHVYDLANELKARINEHFADTTIHNSAETDTITLSDATTNETLMDLVEDLRLKYTQHIENATHHDAADTTNQLTAHNSLKSSPSFTSDKHNGLGLGATESMLTELVALRTFFNAHDAEQGTVHNAGDSSLYQVTNNTSSSATYTYAFYYSYTYKVGPVEFVDQGPTLQKTVSNTAPIGNYSQAITNIPELLNGSGDNYDLTEIKVTIFRTTSGGDIFYKVGEVDNGVTTFTDQVTDSDLTLQELLYTTGGVLDNDPPPVCKAMHILGGIALYGNVKDTDGTSLPNRVRQGVQNDPDSAPASLFDDLEDNVVSISSAKNKFVVLCENSFYRTEGQFDETGRGFLRHEKIADIGCVSSNSVVRTEFGVFFAGTNGFYFTDGFQATRVSGKIEETYKAFIDTNNKKKRIYGAYDSLNRRVWWAVQEDGANFDNDKVYILDLQFGINEAGAFTTASNGLDFKPSALLFSGEVMYRGDNRGYVFSHHKDRKSDPKVDTTTASSTWTTKAITYELRTAALDFGSIQQRKWGTRVNFIGKDTSNQSIQIKNINDDKTITSLKPIRYRDNLLWGDEDRLWGDSTLTWSRSKRLVDKWRRNVAGSMRFNYKQLVITNDSNSIVDNSGDKGTAALDSTTMRATLDTATNKWPYKPEDLYLSSEVDNYVQTFKIVERVSDTIIRIEGKYVITTGTNDSLDYKETAAGSEKTLTIPAGTYTPAELAQKITHLFDDVAVLASQQITCTFTPSTQAFTFSTVASSNFELLAATGTNVATDIFNDLGFSTDQTGATTYTGTAARGNLPATAAAQKWQISGTPKEERVHIQALNIQWSPLTPGRSQSSFGGSSESGNQAT